LIAQPFAERSVVVDSFQEQLESQHTFPGPFTLKVIGQASDAFLPDVLEVVRRELSLTDAPRHSVKRTPNGRHLSVTLELMVSTSGDVVAIYAQLKLVQGLVMVL